MFFNLRSNGSALRIENCIQGRGFTRITNLAAISAA
jgi:hypothetical protein